MAPPPRVATQRKATAPSPSDKTVPTVTLLVVVSDTGYVCSARVLKGINKEIDKAAREAVLKWRFKPAMKDGKPVPVSVSVELHYKADANGKLVADSPSSDANTSAQ
jgi:TonB family protein